MVGFRPTGKEYFVKYPFSCLVATTSFLTSIGCVTSMAGMGVVTGLVLNYFLNYETRDYGAYKIEEYEEDMTALLKKYNKTSKSNYLTALKPHELANIARYKLERHEYVKSVGLGSVKASIVTQTIESYYQKSQDTYFFENISLGFKNIFKRFYQKGDMVDQYTGDGHAEWNHEPVESLNLTQFEEKWGRNLSRSSIFIISNKTVLSDQSSASKAGNEIHVSLELHPITSVLRYVKQMVATSDLDAAPNFHKMHIDMVLDEDLNLLSSKTDELYDVKSFGITAKNSKGYLQETFIYDVPEELVGLDEACDYVIGG